MTISNDCHTSQVRVTNFNGDAYADMAVSHLEEVGIYLGGPGGALTLLTDLPVTHAIGGIAVGDIEGDGDIDLVAVENYRDPLFNGDKAIVLENDGAATFAAGVSYEVRQRPTWVELIDMDRDGALDIVVSNDFVADLDVLRGLGDGTFDARRVIEIEAYDIAARFEAADRNGDQIPDLVTTHRYGNDVRVLLSNP